MRIKRLLIVFIGIIFFLNTSCVLFAGQLDDFEKTATKNRNTSSENNDDDDDDSFWGEFFGEIFSVLFIESVKGLFSLIKHGGQLSLARVQGSSDPAFEDILLREKGSPDLPFFKADINYHLIHSDIDGFDGRVEVGYGPIGIQYRNTYFNEDSPEAHMNLSYVHGLYRVSGSRVFEIDAGIGAMMLKGESRNSGPSITFPINIYPHPNLNIRLVPTWSAINGNGIGDYDGSIAYVRKYFSLRLGYERIQTGDAVLKGPYAGVSLHY
jgi:hypothetical protein